MTVQIRKRSDVNSEEGIREYGHVEFADPVNNKYPIDTAEHVMAAWRYIHKQRNWEEYSDEEAELIEARIMKAAEDHGLRVWSSPDGQMHIGED